MLLRKEMQIEPPSISPFLPIGLTKMQKFSNLLGWRGRGQVGTLGTQQDQNLCDILALIITTYGPASQLNNSTSRSLRNINTLTHSKCHMYKGFYCGIGLNPQINKKQPKHPSVGCRDRKQWPFHVWHTVNGPGGPSGPVSNILC